MTHNALWKGAKIAIAGLTLASVSATSLLALETVGGIDINGKPYESIDPALAADSGGDPTKISDGKGIENVVTVIGSYGGKEYTNDAFENVDVVTADPRIYIDKAADKTSNVGVGDVITYTFTITNKGNVLLQKVGLKDQHVSASGTTSLDIGKCEVKEDATITGADGNTYNGDDTKVNGTANGLDQFGPGDVVVCFATYTVTQEDVDSLQQ